MLAVVAAVLGILLLLDDGGGDGASRDEVRSVSEDFAVALTSYDHRDLEAGFDRVRSMATTGYREEFDELLAGQQLADALEESEARSVAEVTKGPFVVTLTDDEARTVTVVEQQITNNQAREPAANQTQVYLYLVRLEDGGWKVDRVRTP